MGAWADSIVDRHLACEPPDMPRKRPKHRRGFQARSGDYNWRLSSGKVVAMRSMTDEHLENALKTCEDRGNVGKAQQLREVIEERRKASEE